MNGTIEPVSPPNDRATAKEATVIRNGTSNTEWIIYTLCITGFFVLTVLYHLFRKYRKRHALDFRVVNEKVISKPLELTSYIDDIYDEVDENPLTFFTMGSNNTSQASRIDDIYDEVDENPLAFVTMGSNVTSQASHNETINFVFDDKQSNIAGNEHEEAGYFDLYFGMKEGADEQQENRALQKESISTSSSNSNVVGQNNTEYPKPYIPLQEYFQEESHACEIAVMVHQCIERSSGSDKDAKMNIYSNVNIPLQKDRQMNSQANENQLSHNSKTVHDTTLQTALPSVYRTGYFKDHINKYIYYASDNNIANCGEIESFKDKTFENRNPKTL
ncbi:uncharacterized protein LOC127709498 [Mytilus californianus]|uniref:uncharacterized protein LOC127709498 n=1 Tax=Mytilus californianus TaxID=6549 RepID=UPI00224692F9|nr:uncharacterized protein LOC127709498 [Mytilus californianus]